MEEKNKKKKKREIEEKQANGIFERRQWMLRKTKQGVMGKTRNVKGRRGKERKMRRQGEQGKEGPEKERNWNEK